MPSAESALWGGNGIREGGAIRSEGMTGRWRWVGFASLAVCALLVFGLYLSAARRHQETPQLSKSEEEIGFQRFAFVLPSRLR